MSPTCVPRSITLLVRRTPTRPVAPHHTRIADAFVELCQAYNAGTVTGGRERPKVLVTVPFETVVERGTARGVIIGIDATVSADTVRQMCCDAELNRVVTRGASTILDYGTTTRLASTPSTTRWWPTTEAVDGPDAIDHRAGARRITSTK